MSDTDCYDSYCDFTELARDPKQIAQAYTSDSIWRNRSTFIAGTTAIEHFLTQKWKREKSYCLRKELFAFTDNKIAVQFWCDRRAISMWDSPADWTSYEYQDADDDMKWKRCYGLEDWTFSEDGKMRKRQMSGTGVLISEDERWFKDGLDINAVEISEKHW